jgi:hypothetical protein
VKKRKDLLVIVILVVLAPPVTKASDIHELPIIFLYAFVEYFE